MTAWEEVFLKNLKQDKLSVEQMLAVNSGATKAKVEEWDKYAAYIALKADASDLPYALVAAGQTGDWQFSDGETYTITCAQEDEGEGSGEWTICAFDIVGVSYTLNESSVYATDAEASAALDALTSCSFTIDESTVTATRVYALQDRSINQVSLSFGAPFRFPVPVPGKVRDFLVRIDLAQELSGSLDWLGSTSAETIVRESEDGSEPYPTDVTAGKSYLFSFTETKQAFDGSGNVVSSWWAESMKPLMEVSASNS